MYTGFFPKFMLSCLEPDPTHLRVGLASYRALTISVLKSIASEHFSVRLPNFKKRIFLGIKLLTHANFSVLDKILIKNLMKKKT